MNICPTCKERLYTSLDELAHEKGHAKVGTQKRLKSKRTVTKPVTPTGLSTLLSHVDNAKREILAADSLVKVKELWNKADAMRALGQAAKDPELINHATEFKLRCERRLGEMLEQEAPHGGDPATRQGRGGPTLAELGVSKEISARSRRIASIPEDKFEAALAVAREEEKQITRNTVEALIGHNHRAQGTGDNEWYTPAKYIEMARKVMGAIDLDPASSAKANEVIKASRYFTIQSDGLKKPWEGRIWLNPPYSQPAIQQFSKKLVSEVLSGNVVEAIALTHNYTDTAWFHVLADQAQALCFTRGRIAFVDSHNNPCAPTQGQVFFTSGVTLESSTGYFSRWDASLKGYQMRGDQKCPCGCHWNWGWLDGALRLFWAKARSST